MSEPESLQDEAGRTDSPEPPTQQPNEPIALDAGASLEAPAAGPDAAALPYPVAAIGASAGGLEACRDLIKNLGSNVGMTIVVLTHLAPDVKSHLVEIIRSYSSIPVDAVENGMRPEPGHIYVLPPNALATIRGGRFVIEPRPESGRPPMPIDYFFRSLAADQKSRAVGVVLSGADHDGALGLKAIRAEGGIAIVQTPESSRFTGMPRASIAAEHVDLVLPPGRIGAELTRLGAQFGRADIRRMQDEDAWRLSGEQRVWTRLLNLLSADSGIDFRQHNPAALRGRVARRIVINRSRSIADYLRYAQTHPQEVATLAEDMLIKSTHFFSDPEVFEAVKRLLPRLTEDRPDDQPLRIWNPGCYTGEEAYSLAICLLEHQMAAHRAFGVQIFGTHSGQRAIQTARAGQYPEGIVADVSPERLRRYFVRTEKGYYQVSKRVRDLCIFALQNLWSDPPFSRIDLISCRSMLSDFGQTLQKQALSVLHYALRDDGYLLLGPSDTLRGLGELFRMVDRRAGIYQKVATAHPEQLNLAGFRLLPKSRMLETPAAATAEEWSDAELQRATDRLILARFAPAGLVIDEDFRILQTRGDTEGQFLTLSPGASRYQLELMLRGPLAGKVREAMQRATVTELPVQLKNVQTLDGEAIRNITVEVIPLQSAIYRKRCYLVLFLPAEEPPRPEPGPEIAEAASPDQKDQLIHQLRNELSASKALVQSLIEARETRDQDLLSASEEMQSTNEELQSANEELETTREEMQSAFEETQTLNQELEQRNSDLARTSNDLNTLLASVHIPMLVLSKSMEIRYFTQPMQRLLNVLPQDIGRPVDDLSHKLAIDDLRPIVRQVLDTLKPYETEVRDLQGRWYLMRVRPCRTAEDRIEGAVLVLLDIDRLRQTQDELRVSRDFAVSVVESVFVPLAVLDMNLTVRTVNGAFRSLPGWAEHPVGRNFMDPAPGGWDPRPLRGPLEELRRQTEPGGAFDVDIHAGGPDSRTFHVRGRGIGSGGGRVILVTVEEITDRRAADERARFTTEALSRTQAELRALTVRLFQAQEDERRWVARELHDAVGQKLALFDMDLQALQDNLSARGRRAPERLAALRDMAAGLVDEVRNLSHRLHPSILEDLGLLPALRSLTEDFGRRDGMLATFASHGAPDRLPRETAAALYRIAQEALRNAAKHSGRTHVKVTLESQDNIVRLRVADLGQGFDPEDASGGLGLISMAERARMVGGSFRVDSALGKGTTVTVEAPMNVESE